MRVALRWCGRGLLVLMLLVAGLWGYAEGRQWVFRLRAQRLLADVKALQVNKSSWEDFERFRARWGKWGRYEDTCDANSCAYLVELHVGTHGTWLWWRGDVGYPVRDELLEAVGLRPADICSTLVLERGKLIEKHFQIQVDSMKRSLLAGSTEAPQLGKYGNRRLHLNRSFGLYKGFYFLVRNTPDEDADEKSRLMDFRLECITAARPCDSHERLLPNAFEEYRAESHGDDEDRLNCDVPFWVVARDEEAVVEGDVVSASRASTFDRPYDWVVKIRLANLMKWKPEPAPIGTVTIKQQLSVPIANGVYPYKRVIAAGGFIEFPTPPDNLMYASDCSIVDDTPNMRAYALKGVRADFGSTR